ncbi:hypothetical protein QQ045_018349 [Rhodiola kirilowii]
MKIIEGRGGGVASSNQATSIEDLPEDVILSIMSNLKLRDVLNISNVSKRWAHVPCCLDSIKLGRHSMATSGMQLVCSNAGKDAFFERVNQFLQHYNKLRSTVKLPISPHSLVIDFCLDKDSSSEIDSWISMAIHNGATSLTLTLACALHYDMKSIRRSYDKQYIFPWQLINEMSPFVLKSLDLWSCSFKCRLISKMTSLEILEIGDTLVTDYDMDRIRHCCPNLRKIVLTLCRVPAKLTFAGGSLRCLMVLFCFGLKEIQVLNGRELAEFRYTGTHARFNFIGASKLTIITFSMFDDEGVDYVFQNLSRDFPAMTSLSFCGIHKSLPSIPPCTLDDAKNGPVQHLHKCLKFIKISGFCGGSGSVELAEFLVRASEALQHVVIEQKLVGILLTGLQHDGHLTSQLVRFSALSPSGSVDHARLIVYHSDISIRSSWNMLIRGYVDHCKHQQAIDVFFSMRSRGIRPNNFTFPFLFKACAAVLDFSAGRQFHVQVFKYGLEADVYVNNSLIHFYGACNKGKDARKAFDEMPEKTIVSWSSVISTCSKFVDAVELFLKIGDSGFEPDETTFVIMLSACARASDLSFGKCLHSKVVQSGMVMNCQLGTAIVDMYAKCGVVEYAASVFRRMKEKNVWTWSAMIFGLAQHGSAHKALELFQLMKSSSVRPNYVTYVGVLSACSHAGLVDCGHQFFSDMQVVYGIRPMMIHYGAMVDILARAGRLKEAYSFILNMPIDPDPVVWRTLLSACRIHDAEDSEGVGESVRKKLLELEPKRGGNLVMVANRYAEVGMFEKAASLRKVMTRVGSKKIPGESSVVVDGVLQGFFSG